MTYTHYLPTGQNTKFRENNGTMVSTPEALVFELGSCESCEGPVQEVNAVKMAAYQAEALGLEKYEGDAPAEIAFNELEGVCDCENCVE
jgi:hypothetical protein